MNSSVRVLFITGTMGKYSVGDRPLEIDHIDQTKVENGIIPCIARP